MQAQKVGLADIFAEARELLSAHVSLLAITAIAIGVAFFLLDWLSLSMEDTSALLLFYSLLLIYSIAGSAVSIFAQYIVTERLLADRKSVGQTVSGRRYGTLFVALLLSGLAIGLGVLLLIVPAIYLAGRWLTLAPHLIEGNLDAGEAMRQSWNASEHSQLAFCLAVVLVLLPMIPSIALSFSPWAVLGESQPMLTTLVVNVLSTISSVLGWVLAVAAYRRAVPIEGQYEDVFA